jgi:hypothetical protein
MAHISFVDLTGNRYGKLVVLERSEDAITKSGKKLVTWKCRCDCGKLCVVRSANLKSGNTQSCGCVADKIRHTKRNDPNCNAEDFIGRHFGLLVVEKEIKPYRDPQGNKRRRFRCRCYCGKTRDLRIDELTNGIVCSCGCIPPKKYGKLLSFLGQS